MYSSLVTLQFGPLSYAYGNAYFCLESDQFYEEDDPMDHSCLFSNLTKKTPRNIAWSFKDEMDVLKFYSTASMNQKTKKNINPVDSNLWDTQRVQEIDTNQDINETTSDNKEQSASQSKFFPLFKETQFDRKYQVELPFLLDSKFDTFQEGSILAKSEEISEMNEDRIRQMLEQTDFVSGFQVLVDANTGFAGLCEEVLYFVKDECPKSNILTFNLLDYDPTQAANSRNFVNEIISIDRFRDLSSIVVPINLHRLASFSQYINYSPQMDAFDKALTVGSIISGFTASYRTKDSQGLSEYAKTIVSMPANNIFNSTFTIPIVSDEEGTLVNPHIFELNAQKSKFQYLYSDFSKGWNDQAWGAPESFGEAYFLRGQVKMPSQPPKAEFINIRMLDGLMNYKTKYYRHLYAQQIQESYLYQLETRENYNEFQLPLHTSIFSNQQFALKIQQLVNAQKIISKQTKVAYYQLDYTEEDFDEMRHRYQDLFESYARDAQIQEEKQQL